MWNASQVMFCLQCENISPVKQLSDSRKIDEAESKDAKKKK